jgi:hypothetical protein
MTQRAPAPNSVDRTILFLLGVGIVLIPVDGAKILGALGELNGLACFPPFAMSIALAIYSLSRSGLAGIRGAFWVTAVASVILAASAVANADTIVGGVFHDRSGLSKFTTSLSVILYGFALAAVIESRPPERLAGILTLCVALSVVACLLFGALEFAAKHGASTALYTTLDHLVHSADNPINPWDGTINLKLVYGWDPRLRTLSFEPPAFGNFSGFAWPWLLYGVLAGRTASRIAYAIALALFTLLILVSGARTGWLMLGANVAVAVVLRAIYFTPSRQPLLALMRLAAPIGCAGALAFFLWNFAANYDAFVRRVVGGDSISDLSRAASQIAAFRMFLAHPLFGFGLGQFAFHEAEFLPVWGFLSSEIWPSIIYPNGPWPAVYSMFGRLAGETGVAGLGGWCALWIWLFFRLIVAERAFRMGPAAVGRLAYPLAMSCVDVLVSGTTTDTFRTPMIWVSLGLSFAFLRVAGAPSALRASLEAR